MRIVRQMTTIAVGALLAVSVLAGAFVLTMAAQSILVTFPEE
jgi:hypothetical protein